jgi:hypothetical protein
MKKICAKRSNCPRYAVWDDAVTDGLVAVVLTSRGLVAPEKVLLKT